MRTMIRQQQVFMQAFIDHEHARELAEMSDALDRCSAALSRVTKDIARGRSVNRGRPGMTAEQVVRALVVKQMNDFSYDELAFHLSDSTCYRVFCRIGDFEKAPSKSTLQENIKRVSARALEAIHRALLGVAQEEEIESGQTVRGDCTTVETNIHPPTDSWLLWDTVRVLVRLLKRSRKFGVDFSNHQRLAKRRFRQIGNMRDREERARLYRELLEGTEKTLGDAQNAIEELQSWDDGEAQILVARLKHHVTLGRRVIEQTRRRVLQGETVPSTEKVVSIFEDHTDILAKGKPRPEYGHKICLTTGPASMVLDCVVLRGNPADKTLATQMIERHRDIFGAVPEQVAFDGGFASKANVNEIKRMGVDDVAFSKRCGLSISEMVTDSWVYRRLRNFRAGIEGCISFFKRCFGLRRCSWKGWRSFEAYVWASILSANLLTLARHRLTA